MTPRDSAADPDALLPPDVLATELRAEILAIVADDEELARIAARKAARIDRARRLVLRSNPVDKSTGGPKWSSVQVAEAEIATELAAALRVTETDARRQLDTAYGLTHDYGNTYAALCAGAFSYRHAQIIVKHGTGLPADVRVAYEKRMLELAPRVTAYQLENAARATVEEAQTQTAVERHRTAAESRYLSRENAPNGMAYLTLFTPAVEAVAIENRATAIAKSAKTAGDPRTMTQLKADAVSDLLLNGEPSMTGVRAGIVPRVHVTVPAMTLLGHSDEPARLTGYGPIDRDTAIRLTRNAPSFLRVLTDPITGAFIPETPERYKPGTILDDFVKLVHGRCGFTSCEKPAQICETDHSKEYSLGGQTTLRNLAPLCEPHHDKKTRTHWGLTQNNDGTLHWTSPAGFDYTSPPGGMRPAPQFLLHPEKPPEPEPGDEDPPPF